MNLVKITNGFYGRCSKDFYNKRYLFVDNNSFLIEGIKVNGLNDGQKEYQPPIEAVNLLLYNVDLSRINSSKQFWVLHWPLLLGFSVSNGSFVESIRYTLNRIYYNTDRQIVCNLNGDTRNLVLIDAITNTVYSDDLEGRYIRKIFNITSNRIRVVCWDSDNLLVKDYVLGNSGYLIPFKVYASGINSGDVTVIGQSFVGRNNQDSTKLTFTTYNYEEKVQYTVKLLNSTFDQSNIVSFKQKDSTSYYLLGRNNNQFYLGLASIDFVNKTISISTLYSEYLRSTSGNIFFDDYAIYRRYYNDLEIIEIDQDNAVLYYKGIINKGMPFQIMYDFVNKKNIIVYYQDNQATSSEGSIQIPVDCNYNVSSQNLDDTDYYVDIRFIPEQIVYTGSSVPGVLKVAVKNNKDEFVSKLVKITINSKALAIFENNQYTITVLTSKDNYVDVPITYLDAGILDITTEIIESVNT